MALIGPASTVPKLVDLFIYNRSRAKSLRYLYIVTLAKTPIVAET
jgi:hypothetical protein